MNTSTKILNKILANQIKWDDQLRLILRFMHRYFNICKSINVVYHINTMNDKKYHHLNRCKKSSDNIQHPLMIKLQQTGYRRNIPHHNKATYDKVTDNIIPNGERLAAFLLGSGKR